MDRYRDAARPDRVVRTSERSGPGPGPGNRRGGARHPARQAFSSRGALRRAILVREILGVPKGLQPPGSDAVAPAEGAAPPATSSLQNGRRRVGTGPANGNAAIATTVHPRATRNDEAPGRDEESSGDIRRGDSDDWSVVRRVQRALGASVFAVRRLFER